MKINRVPSYAADYKYIVYRVVNGQNWFYGAYNDVSKAAQVATEISGLFVERGKIDV
jgi:hypothetical protein